MGVDWVTIREMGLESGKKAGIELAREPVRRPIVTQ
jgi:hypothetical protein